ncbi:MAG TPA: sortase [Roseiflexaceae bacterium]|nr:sortase [Roseiflexaceae bacterium]HMP39041.1 sortase [Roseiflexaceae bacterium]
MVQTSQSVKSARAHHPATPRARVMWTLGNLLMLVGVVIIAYLGGLAAHQEYQRYAARGDTEAPAPRDVSPVIVEEAAPLPFIAPLLNSPPAAAGRVVSELPVDRFAQPSSITRIAIPSIDLDSKVVEVGWDVVEQEGRQVAVWQVAEYAVGHHRGSANPGDAENIVLAGHVGGYGKVFKDLIELQPGDRITIYSGDQQYLYTVSEQHMLLEEGVSEEQRAANAAYIAPGGSEMLTLVTCWPDTGPERFNYRIIVRAVPFIAPADPAAPTLVSSTLR